MLSSVKMNQDKTICGIFFSFQVKKYGGKKKSGGGRGVVFKPKKKKRFMIYKCSFVG